MFDIRIDTSGLTYTQFMIPELSPALIEGADAPTIHLEPREYSFHQMDLPAFRFKITPEGLIDYDVANEGFLDGRGTTTLTVRGFTITIDGTLLSDDLLPNVFRAGILSRSSTHDLTLVPASGYSFMLTAIIDFKFDVTVDGQVAVDPRYAGFAEASGRTLKIKGYKIMIDGTALSHDLLPEGMLGNNDVLPRNRTNEFTYMPAANYSFSNGGSTDFRFDVTVGGQVSVDPLYAGFASASGQTLIISGYRIMIDGRTFSRDLSLRAILGITGVMTRDRTHEFTLIPLIGAYVLDIVPGVPGIDFRFKLSLNGEITMLNVPIISR
jgi:hypothetical protein